MMNLHIVTHQHSDANARMLTEGWLWLKPEGLRVRVSGDQTYLPPAQDFWETLPQSDAIILCVTGGPQSPALTRAEKIIDMRKKWGHTVLLDYHDSARRWPYERIGRKVRWALLGRRHLYERLAAHWDNAKWWPRLGIEERVRRYRGALPWRDWKDIEAVCLYRVYDKAGHRQKWMEIAGRLGAKTGTATHGIRHPLYERTASFRHCPNYYELLSRARVGIHLMGGNTAMGYQFWEYAALDCALLAQHPSLHPQADIERAEWEALGLREGEDFEYFHGAHEFEAKYRALAADPARCQAMAKRVAQKVAPYHSTVRASEMLALLESIRGQ